MFDLDKKFKDVHMKNFIRKLLSKKTNLIYIKLRKNHK